MRLGSLRPPKSGGAWERSLAALAKHYPNAKRDVDGERSKLVASRVDVPAPPGITQVSGVGRTILKVRAASSDMQPGKSGGFRVLLCHREGDEWAPMLVYAKPKRGTVPRSEILEAIADEGV